MYIADFYIPTLSSPSTLSTSTVSFVNFHIVEILYYRLSFIELTPPNRPLQAQVAHHRCEVYNWLSKASLGLIWLGEKSLFLYLQYDYLQ
jgi:hypothetical protein